jgi:tape measure domain-containing protein
MENLDDHIFQLKWDSSLIDKGFKDLENKFNRFNSQTFEPKVRQGSPSSSSAGQISDVARIKQQEQIERARIDAEAKIASLQKIGSKEAKENIRQLTVLVKRLDKAENSLSKAVNRNDKEFKEYTSQLSQARLGISQVSHQTRGLTREFNAQKFAASGLSQSLKNLARSWISVFAVMAGGRAVLNTSKQFQDMKNTLLLASGSAEQAAKDIKFLKDMSMEMGVSFLDSSKAFAKYSVSARGAGLTDGEMKTSFEELSVAIRATGLNQDDANLSFLALQQMLSNGVVSMEELRKQLSERMPQTMEVAKKALRNLGYEFESVEQIISSGQVKSGPFVKELTRLMAEQAKTTGAYESAIKSTTAEQQRFDNALKFTIERMAEAGILNAAVNIFSGLKNVVLALSPAFVGLSYAFSALTEVIAAPFKVLDEFAQLLGMEEGQGIQAAIRLVAFLLVGKLAQSLAITYAAIAKNLIAVKDLAKGYFLWATGASTAATATNMLKNSVKALLRTVLPLWLAFEGINWAIDRFSSKNSTGASTSMSSVTKNAENSLKGSFSGGITINTLEVSSTGHGDARDFAETIVRELRDLSDSQMPIV